MGPALSPVQGSDNVFLLFSYLRYGQLSVQRKATELSENNHVIKENNAFHFSYEY